MDINTILCWNSRLAACFTSLGKLFFRHDGVSDKLRQPRGCVELLSPFFYVRFSSFEKEHIFLTAAGPEQGNIEIPCFTDKIAFG